MSETLNTRQTPGTGTIAGFVERTAAAFAASIPEDPADDGFFGPGSVTWRLTADLSAPVAGLRSLIVQALHPLAMAGVDQHSDWRRDPVGRFTATTTYVLTVTYGDEASARRNASVVRKIHEHVHGTDAVTGKPYRADDPDLLLWVHAVQVESTLRAAQLFGAGVSDADADAYVAEMTAAARLIGMPDGLAPATVAELDAYLAAVQPDLLRTRAAEDTAAFLLDPPGMDPEIAELWDETKEGVLASLPAWATDIYGFSRIDVTKERREEIRQALGVFDALTLGAPGVLEARQRIELRIRQARASQAQAGQARASQAQAGQARASQAPRG
ncbi:MAG: oxygenase MpaB family protein [Trebonia sp.]